ncbi:C-Maf-inducing protein-like [Ctenocephalides felis]|uniref:C-Maf-inducing protein-like n=1 Tax=Ctenocephalides felis TaxID=7515 RepID=UPI000E6E1061|nr:C-Maf-inducing protein-like [Ctenocephalides felis]
MQEPIDNLVHPILLMGSPGPWPPSNPSQPPPSPGPRYALLREADVQVCCLNHARTVVSKVLSSRFLRRWETLRLRLNDADIEAEEGSGLLQKPLTYASMQDVYTVNRWDATGRYCLRIVVPEGSVLLQAASSYVRDQWFHSIVWKKNLHKYKSVLSQSRSPEIILKELKCLVDFAATTPLQDDCIMNEPIAIVSELLDQPDHICSRASLLRTSAPLLEDAPASAPLCRHVAKYCLHPYDEISSDSESSNDSLSFSAVDRLVRRILKHGADYSTSPHARDLVRDYLAAIGGGVGGRERLAAFVESVHGPGSACPHPRVLPNLASVCFAGITARLEELDHEPVKINGHKIENSPATDFSGDSVSEKSCDTVDNLNKINKAEPLILIPTSDVNLIDLEEQQNIKNEALNNLNSKSDAEDQKKTDAEIVDVDQDSCKENESNSSQLNAEDADESKTLPKSDLEVDEDNSHSPTKDTKPSTILEHIVLNNKALIDNTTKVLNETKQVLMQGLRTQRLMDQSREHLIGNVDEEEDVSTEDTGSYRTCLEIEYGPDCEEISLLESNMEVIDAQIQIFATVLELISSHSSWLPYLASLLQPLPFPAKAMTSPGFLRAMAPTVRRLATSRQCEVHRTLMPVRPTKKGWLDLYCPVTGEYNMCPDGGKVWCLMLSTLLGCCGRRKRFLLQHLIPKRLEDCFRLASQPWAGSVRLVLALVIEWDLLGQMA